MNLTVSCEVGEVVMQRDEACMQQGDDGVSRRTLHTEQINCPCVMLCLGPVTSGESLITEILSPTFPILTP